MTVIDPDGVCVPPPPPAFVLEGAIRTPAGVPVAEIPLTLQGDGFFAAAESGPDGRFLFEDLPGNNYFTLTPANNAKWLNGLTTFDLVLISKHILGLDTLDTPFQLIAADANRSGTVTTFDIVQFRKVILGISDTVPGNTSWRFMDASYVFPNPAMPFGTAFPEQKIFNSLSDTLTAEDFVGIKIGDINNSTDAADPRGPRDEIYIGVSNATLPAGTTVALPFYLKDWGQLEGLQFELQFDTGLIAFQDIQFVRPDLFNGSNWAFKPDGRLALSWDNATVPDIQVADSLLFTLYLRAGMPAAPRAVLHLAAERLVPEAYRAGAVQPAALSLRYHDKPAQTPETCMAAAARPNPFSDETILPFYLPEAAVLTLRIADGSGKIIYEKTTEFPAGGGQWRIGKELLDGTGAYGYRISSSTRQGWGGVLVLLGE